MKKMINIILNRIILELEIHIKACTVLLDGESLEHEEYALNKIQAYENAIKIVEGYKENIPYRKDVFKNLNWRCKSCERILRNSHYKSLYCRYIILLKVYLKQRLEYTNVDS